MADENTNTSTSKKTEKAEKAIDLAEFESMAKRYRQAPGKEACAKIVAENPDLFKAGILRSRRADREALPMVTRLLSRAEETHVGSWGLGLSVLGGLGFAGLSIYKGIKMGWEYFRPV